VAPVGAAVRTHEAIHASLGSSVAPWQAEISLISLTASSLGVLGP
jgi:hypothetical protein